MKLYRISNLFLLAALLVSCGPVPPNSMLSMEGGWVRAMPPGAKMTAAYGVITNHGTDSIEIISFTSDSFSNTSLHLTTVENGVSRMEQLPGLAQPPGASSVLEPGGLHLMLMHPIRSLRPGDSVGLTLITSNGEQFHFFLPVEAR